LLLKEQQFVAERATRTENKTLKQDFKTRGVVVNTQSFNPEGNADPKTSNSAASDNLDFLSEKESVYEPSIREALETFPPDFIQQAFTHLLKGDHRKATPTASLLALRKKYGHVKLMAALVLAGCETKGGASLKYLEGFMKRWQAPAPSPAIAGGGPVQFPVYDDPESFLDDPEVIGR